MNKYTITPIPIKPKEKHKNTIFPLPLRCLIVGSSGCGKSTLMWNLITKNWIPYKNLYIFSKSMDQPVYTQLKNIYASIEEEVNHDIAHFFDHCEDIIPVDDCERNSLMIFDDCILEKQSPIKEYFVRGRHKNISCIYLSQCISLVDLKTIRNNLNFLCIFKQNGHYMKMIYDNFIGSDMTFLDFKSMSERCWERDYDFLTIDLTRKANDGRFKCAFEKI